MANDFDKMTLEAIFAPQAQALQALAMRPQKTSATTTSTSTSTPYALEDLISTRNRIGESSRALDDALKAREDFGYTLANALAGVSQQQGAGSWLSDFARGFGGGFATPINLAIDRAQKKYESEMKDLADILAFDKALGETSVQTQDQVMGYTPVATGKKEDKKEEQSEIPVVDPEYWKQMIANFDKRKPTEASYRSRSQFRQKLENKTAVLGDPDEAYAREQFNTVKGRDFLPMARNALKGAGQITDFEDKKYTEWINSAENPVQLKDTAVRIVNSVALKNGWTKEQKAKGLELLGLTSEAEGLLPQQKQYEPERVKSSNVNVEDILKKFGAKRVD